MLEVREEAAAKAAVQIAMDTFGRLDVLVNNAGYGPCAPFEQMSRRRAVAIGNGSARNSLRQAPRCGERGLARAECFWEHPVIFDEIPRDCIALPATDSREQLPSPRVEQSRFDPETALSMKLSKQSQEDGHADCNRDHAARHCETRASGDVRVDHNHGPPNNARDLDKLQLHTDSNTSTRRPSPPRTAGPRSCHALG
jgi:NAD(P)-dependent dehydrogenase (short-subunit alcohol dehydrogenase family)